MTHLPGFNLNERDLQLLSLIGAGLPDKAIAAELGLSPKTIAYHIICSENPRCIGTKLGLSSRPQLVAFAVKHNLSQPTVNAPKTEPKELKTTSDLAQALLRGASQAAANQADPLQINSLCQCTDALIRLAKMQMDAKANDSKVNWIGI
jgi:DNA-binding CsgD family transcriptional regulator